MMVFDARPSECSCLLSKAARCFYTGRLLINPVMFQDLQTWAYGAYTPDLNGMNDTGVCLTQPGEPPATMKMMAIVTVGSGRLVALYGSPSSVVWLPQGRELPSTTKGNEELTVVLGLTKRVGI